MRLQPVLVQNSLHGGLGGASQIVMASALRLLAHVSHPGLARPQFSGITSSLGLMQARCTTQALSPLLELKAPLDLLNLRMEEFRGGVLEFDLPITGQAAPPARPNPQADSSVASPATHGKAHAAYWIRRGLCERG